MAKKQKPTNEDIIAAEMEKIPSEPAKTQGSPQKTKTGRPSKYDPEIARVICEQLSDGIPLRQICRDNEGFPAWRTVYDWMAKDDALGDDGVGLSAAIARAREIGYDAIAEECLIIADTPKIGIRKVYSSGAEEGEDSMTVTEEDMLGHRKLQIETRLKLLAKFNPKKYGERVQLANDENNPIDLGNTLFGDLLKNVELKLQSKAAED